MFKWDVILTPEIYNYRDLRNLSFLKQICRFIRKPIEYANCLNPFNAMLINVDLSLKHYL